MICPARTLLLFYTTHLQLCQENKLNFPKEKLTTTEKLDSYEKCWYASIYQPSKDNIQIEVGILAKCLLD